MKTLSYVLGQERKIEIGQEYYFGQLWDGEGDGEELLESGSIAIYDKNGEFDVYDFEVVKKDDNIMNAIVKVI